VARRKCLSRSPTRRNRRVSSSETWVATRATDSHWAHGIQFIAEEAHDVKLCEPLYDNETELHLAGICSRQNLDSVFRQSLT
jgi:hypothetical protein